MQAKPTEAVYTLRDPHEVLAFLSKLIGWGRTPSNAWHQAESCIGWALDLSSSAANGYLPAALDNLPGMLLLLESNKSKAVSSRHGRAQNACQLCLLGCPHVP